MARCGDGLALNGDVRVAAERAAREALAPLHGLEPVLACVFVSGADPDATSDALLIANDVLGARTVVGSGADGVVAGARSVDDTAAVAVWVASMPTARVRSFHLEVIRTTDSLAVVGMPQRRDDDKCGLMLADPWSFPAEGFVHGSTDSLEGLPLVGGLAGASAPGRVRLLSDGRIHERGAVGVIIGGAVSAEVAVTHACRPVGPPMTVTASDGDAVMELAGRPAVERLDRVLAELTAQDQALASSGVLIGVVLDEYGDDHGVGDFEVQAVLGADRESGALMFAESIPVGSTVRVHVIDPVSARADLGAAVTALRARAVDGVDGALLFSGTPRGPLYTDPDGDVLAVRRGLHTSAVSGLATIGGIGPVGGSNRLLGFASSLLAIGAGAEDRVATFSN